MINDPYAIKKDANEPSLLGDVFALLGAWAGAGSIKFSSMLPNYIAPTTRIWGILMFASLIYCTVLPFYFGFDVFYSFKERIGYFWWLVDFKMFFYLIFFVWLIWGVLGNSGLSESFKYFPVEIITGIMIMEPVIAQTGGILLGQDNVPGLYTIIGGSIITTAFLMTGYGEKLRDKRNQTVRNKLNQKDQNEYELSLL